MDPGGQSTTTKASGAASERPAGFLPRRLLQFRMRSAHCFDVYLMGWDRSFMHEACSQKDMFRDGMNNSIMMYHQQEIIIHDENA